MILMHLSKRPWTGGQVLYRTCDEQNMEGSCFYSRSVAQGAEAKSARAFRLWVLVRVP